MYLKDKVIKILQIKNILLIIAGIFNIAMSLANLGSLTYVYRDDFDTVLNAKSTPESVIRIVVGIVCLIIVFISRSQIRNAIYYARYFEGDLDGEVSFVELSQLVNKRVFKIRIQMFFYRIFYMKGYNIVAEDGIRKILLNSKISICECRNCGATIEKKIYFSGTCPYCDSSNLFAKVLTDNHFYSITYQPETKKRRSDFYLAKTHRLKLAVSLMCLLFAIAVIIIAGCANISIVRHLNDKDYLRKQILSGKGPSSFRLIKDDMIDSIIWLSALIFALLPFVLSALCKMKLMYVANTCSDYLSRQKSAFILPKRLPPVKKSRHGINAVIKALRRGYLINCSFEVHNGILKMAVAKKIIKDRCPFCGGTIVGVVDDKYKCSYCGKRIMNVISPKE